MDCRPITPRRTTLCRVADLAGFRATLTHWILKLPPEQAGDTIVVVPTRAAAEHVRRTVEHHALDDERTAVIWPVFATRRDLYDELAARLRPAPVQLAAVDREVMLSAVARDLAEQGLTPPFNVRPVLIAEMLGLYDQIRRLGRTVADFDRNLRSQLEPEQEIDRGAARLLQQTLFLSALYRGYEDRLTGETRIDEHLLRAALLERPSARPMTRVIVTVGDHAGDPDGLWPADFDLLSRLPQLQQIDLLSTEAMLAAGLLERLHAALPELEETKSNPPPSPAPALVTPGVTIDSARQLAYVYRDREEELAGVARRVKAERGGADAVPLHRIALVVRRPLPYLYLARSVFADSGIPFETVDTLPLAAEPYAAAVDVVLDLVAGDFTRSRLLALLRSPHFQLGDPDDPIPPSSIAASDFALAEARYLGGLERLERLVERWRGIRAAASRDERRQQLALPALTRALDAARLVEPLGRTRPMTHQLRTLVEWLQQHDRPHAPEESTAERRHRVRAAVLGAMTALSQAYERHDPTAEADISILTAAIRHWLGSQTFAVATGSAGLQIVDAPAARYGEFDDVQIVGLVDGEWPDRPRSNVLYPASLLKPFEPLPVDPNRREREGLASARAAFRDLLFLPARSIRLSSFSLENDAVVESSALLDEVAGFGLRVEESAPPHLRVSYAEALALGPERPEVLPPTAHEWAAVRLRPDDREPSCFQGLAGAWRLPRVSVSRLERYLDCPFRFYASEVLKLEEQPEDEDTRTPLERGRFLHELWERFFAEWQAGGGLRIEPDRVPEARALFERLCEEALGELSPSEAALERTRLLGSAVSPGIAHRVFAMEADRSAAITERLLEFALQGDFVFRFADGGTRMVPISAKVDRIDLLADGTLRVIDYKSKKTPDVKLALQLPIYSYLAREELARSRGTPWPIAEALYLSFEGDKAVKPLRARGRSTDELLAEAQDRLLTTLDRIASGAFPPSPAKKSLCGPCPYRAVCRLELVETNGGAEVD